MRALWGFGYTLKDAFHAVEISKSGYHVRRVPKKSEEIAGVKDADLVDRANGTKEEYPF